jgi:hypothetical protein
MRIVPYRAEHLAALVLQPAQIWLAPVVTDEYRAALERAGPAFTALAGGRVLGCAGVVEHWPGRGVGWAMLAADIGPRFVALHRAVRRYLERQAPRRLEIAVQRDFAAGRRWALLLGFERETPGGMRGYGPDGATYDLYARIRA